MTDAEERAYRTLVNMGAGPKHNKVHWICLVCWEEAERMRVFTARLKAPRQCCFCGDTVDRFMYYETKRVDMMCRGLNV